MAGKKSHDDDHLNFGQIEKEVQSAVISEEKYWRENDAKIRAVEQRVPTYDDFRDMVLAAHLRPLEKGDKISDIGVFTQVWNQSAAREKAANVSSGDGRSQTALGPNKSSVSMPKSGQEFAKAWRHLPNSTEDKNNFLLALGADNIASLFKTEISGGLLGEFLHCLQTFNESQTLAVVQLLEAFTKSQRFSLTLAFLSNSEKACGASLFNKLKSVLNTQESAVTALETVHALEKIYKFG